MAANMWYHHINPEWCGVGELVTVCFRHNLPKDMPSTTIPPK